MNEENNKKNLRYLFKRKGKSKRGLLKNTLSAKGKGIKRDFN
jgi:hypothetical protein